MSMSALDTLSTTAEIAITIAGFAGVVAVFRSSGNFTSEEIRRIIFLVIVNGSVVITALMPNALLDMGFPKQSAISVPSFMLGVMAIFVTLAFTLSIYRGSIRLLFPKVTALLVLGVLSIGAALLLSVLTSLVVASYGLLLVGELVFILIALWIFSTTLLWVKDI